MTHEAIIGIGCSIIWALSFVLGFMIDAMFLGMLLPLLLFIASMILAFC